MAVTLNQMAEAYVESVRTQLQQAKEQAQQANQIVAQIEQHLQECLSQVEAPTTSSPVVENADGTTTETISVNPFQ